MWQVSDEAGNVFAMKEFHLTEQLLDTFCTELALLSQLRHPNIVRFLAYSSSPPQLLLEYVAGGTLEWLLVSNEVLLLPQLALRILVDITCAMAYLHTHSPPYVMISPTDRRLHQSSQTCTDECIATI